MVKQIRKRAFATLMTLAMVISLLLALTLPAKAITNGTADGTYDFGSLGMVTVDGYKTQGDKFKVSSAFVQDGTLIYPNEADGVNSPGASVDLVIKAEGTTVNKKFTFKDLNLSTGDADDFLDIFTITFKDASGTTIAQHELQNNVQVPDTGKNISQFPFTQPFPANGYDNVSEIHMTCSYVTNYFCWLEFNTITIANVTAALATPPAVTTQPNNATVNAGGNTSFTVGATGATGYQWQVNTGSGFSNIANDGVYSNATTATLNITGATADMNGYQYRAVVSGSAELAATSDAATLTVNAAPTVTTPDPITYIDTAVSNAFSKVTGNITATDSDGTITFYGITGGTSGSTVIDAVTYDVSKTGTYGTLYVESLTGKYVFAPNLTTINAVSIDQSETFTVTATDNLDAIGTATLTVNIIGANDTPSNLFLSSSSVNQSGGVNAVVGTLSTSDIDSGQTHTYSLVSGAGDTNNASFNISGDALRANNAAVLAAGTYSVLVRTTDSGAGNLTYDRAFTITVTDDLAPAVTSVAVPANGTYKAGQNLDFTVNFSEAVTVDTLGGTPRIALIIGATTRYATYHSSSGTSALVFRYTVQAGDNDSNGITVGALSANGGTMRDSSGNNANLTLNSIGSTTNVLVDTTSPAVSSIVRQTPSNSPTNAASVIFRVTFNESVTGVDISDFALTKTGDADGTVALVSPVSGTIYDITVNTISGDGTLRLDLNDSGTGIEDAGGNAIAGGYSTGETYSIDNTAPTATISMSQTALYSGETATVTITFSEAVTGFTNADLTISNGTLTAVSSADGGITWTATFTAANVDSATNSIVLALTGITDTAGNTGSGTISSGNYTVSMPTAPGAPTNVTATAGDTQASVSFTAPVSNGGLSITSYTVTSSPGGKTGTGAGSPIVVTGLTNGVAYTFTVTATNSIGTGDASGASNSVTPRAIQTITFAQPSAQTFGTAPTLTATSDSGLPVTFTSQTTGVCTVTPGGVLTFITAGTATITAHQAGNASYLPAESVSRTFTVNPVVPGAPTGVTAIEGDTQASVSFTAPVSTGGTSITGYTVTVSPAHVAPVNGASSPIVVTGLTNGQAYTFTVTATNIAGTGAASAASNSVTPRATQTITFDNPGAQNFGTSPTLAATSDSGLTVTFTSETSVCTILPGNVLQFNSAGEAIITAHQAGDASYLPATSVSRTFTVNPVAPGAPTGVTATAGNAQASVSFTAPVSTGGVAITGYTVTVSPADVPPVNGASSPIVVNGLTNGVAYTFTVTATNSAGTGSASAASNSVTPQAPVYDNTPSTPSTNSAVIEVNGARQDAGTATTTTTGGQTVTTITVDDVKLSKILESSGEKPNVTLPSTGSAVTVGVLTGQTVKNMETKEAVLEIKTETVTYTLPASQINIDAVSALLGSQVELKDIKVSVKIAEPAADTVKIVEDTANKGGYQLIVKPVEFEIICTNGDQIVEVSRFNGYVERTISIPDGIDPSKITTGIVLNADGTFSHVPTQIVEIEGRYYAKINSLTNSTYSVIYNPVTFTDVASHWAKDAVNDMGSRMVVTGIGNGIYEPERSITRAEFAAIVVRAMGLKKGTTESAFGDVTVTDWFNGYVDTATSYSLIAGYNSTTFAPNDTITREQAMTILARAMKLTGLSATLTDSEVAALLANYSDADLVSDYAKAGAAACIKTGVVSGTTASTLSPKDSVTRAEVATMVQRLLQKSGLI